MKETLQCRRCPKYGRNCVCPIKGQYMTPSHPVCDYGRRLIRNEVAAWRMRKRRGSKKRVVLEPTSAEWDRLNNVPEPRRRTRKIRGVRLITGR